MKNYNNKFFTCTTSHDSCIHGPERHKINNATFKHNIFLTLKTFK